VLDRSEAFRFAISPVGAWPPVRFPDWAEAVEEVGREWSACVENQLMALPQLLSEESLESAASALQEDRPDEPELHRLVRVLLADAAG
jgi:hypothetical protein